MESEWLGELRALRRDLGPLRPMLVTWRWKHPWSASEPLWQGLAGPTGDETELWVSLHEPDAPDGSPAVVQVRLDPEGPINGIVDGEVVQVAGRIAPGGAVAVVTPQGVCWPLYPATVTLRQPRLLRSSRRGRPSGDDRERLRRRRRRVGLGAIVAYLALRLLPAVVLGQASTAWLLASVGGFGLLLMAIRGFDAFRARRRHGQT